MGDTRYSRYCCRRFTPSDRITLLPGVQEGKRRPTVFPVDGKIRVERQHRVVLIDFSHADDASIRQRHRHVAELVHQLAQRADVFFDLECEAKGTVL